MLTVVQSSANIAVTLKMATAMLAERLHNYQHSTRPKPESQSFTLNSSRENLRTIILEENYRHLENLTSHLARDSAGRALPSWRRFTYN
jgi:hypothetical protein